jgi:hypothetical protein
MTAKEKQLYFLKSYLKPTLKRNGFQTSGNTWWRNQSDFFTIINLQNFSWNTKDNVDFCFNIGIGLTKFLKDSEKLKAGYSDLVINIREDFYLENLPKHQYRNKTGYFINEDTELSDFLKKVGNDFDSAISPKLDSLKTLNDCIEFYGDIVFWGEHLKRKIAELDS